MWQRASIKRRRVVRGPLSRAPGLRSLGLDEIHRRREFCDQVPKTGAASDIGTRIPCTESLDRGAVVPRGHELAGKKRPALRDLARHALVIPPGEIAMEAGAWMSMGW